MWFCCNSNFPINMFTTNQFSNLIELSFSMSERPSFEMIMLELEHTTCVVFCKYLPTYFLLRLFLHCWYLIWYVLSCSTNAYNQLYTTIPKSANSLLHGGQLGLQSNLAIRNFLVTLKLFLNDKSSLLQTLHSVPERI